MSLAPDDPRHGTYNGYTNLDCRCGKCKLAGTAAIRNWRRLQDGLPPGDPRHGTLNGYDNFRCRCPGCKQAKSDYQRSLVARRKACVVSRYLDLCSPRVASSPAGAALPSAWSTVASAHETGAWSTVASAHETGDGAGADTAATSATTASPAPIVPTPTAEARS